MPSRVSSSSAKPDLLHRAAMMMVPHDVIIPQFLLAKRLDLLKQPEWVGAGLFGGVDGV